MVEGSSTPKLAQSGVAKTVFQQPANWALKRCRAIARVLWTLEQNAISGIVIATKTLEGVGFANIVAQVPKSLRLA